MYITAKAARMIHKAATKANNSLMRGVRLNNSVLSGACGVSVTGIGSGVTVGVPVVVEAGKINVIAGNGIRVVVGVLEGTAVGVYVAEGVPCVAVGCEVLA